MDFHFRGQCEKSGPFLKKKYVNMYFIYINYKITEYMNKIKTRLLPGTKILGVPGIKKIKMI